MSEDGADLEDGGSRPERQGKRGAAEATRRALIEAALVGFGRDGFDGTSTREIASAAGTNIASIAYHFGGKEGLRAACAKHLVETMQSIIRLALRGETIEDYAALPPEAARERMVGALDRMSTFLLQNPQSDSIVRFILRELFSPSDVFDVIYTGVIEPSHRRLCALWSAATGDPVDSEKTRLKVFTIIGQILYFRIGREMVLRRLDWNTIGEREAGAIKEILMRNVDVLIADEGRQTNGG